MEGYETDYAPEEPADQDETITEPEPEESEPEEPEQEELETEPEELETEPETSEKGAAEEQPEEEPGETDADQEEGPAGEETEEPEDETVSGNDLVVSGDVIVFPEDYDLSAIGGEPADTESIVRAVEEQSDIMAAGFTCTCFMLGVLAGALVIAGFRLRRV